MRTIINLSIVFILFLFSSCVQKSYKRIVVFTLDVSNVKNVKKVGIRGEKPLSWDYDLSLKKGNDSLYKTIVTFETGYKFAKCKFTANDEFELQNQDNRRVVFDEKNDTTFYKTTFNSLK